MIFNYLGSCKESGKEYALYSINVYRASSGGTKSWTVFRRYSDFDDLHMHLKEKVGSLGCSMRRELTDVLIVSLLALVQRVRDEHKSAILQTERGWCGWPILEMQVNCPLRLECFLTLLSALSLS